MEVWFWETEGDYFHQLVLFDGENTYWGEHMRPSGGYTKETFGKKYCPTTRSQYFYIGELDSSAGARDDDK